MIIISYRYNTIYVGWYYSSHLYCSTVFLKWQPQANVRSVYSHSATGIFLNSFWISNANNTPQFPGVFAVHFNNCKQLLIEFDSEEIDIIIIIGDHSNVNIIYQIMCILNIHIQAKMKDSLECIFIFLQLVDGDGNAYSYTPLEFVAVIKLLIEDWFYSYVNVEDC